ncbi:MAG: DUF488 domain-containing protein [Chloroflexi bacterium]|nr:DUF488 domain-containing protein [Chloroflexota bacterium]
MSTIYTIGFTRKTAEAFFTLLRESGVTTLVDIRLHNRSQLAGFAKQDDLAWLARELAGIEYVHLPELAPTQELFDSFKRQGGSWEDFEQGFRDVMEQRGAYERFDRALLRGGLCLLCSEAAPEHCHRRLVAEGLAAIEPRLQVEHLQ